MKIPRPLLALPLFALTAFAAPADWPQWRGPNRDGISPSTGLLKEWPADGPPLAWRIGGLGKGLSSVSIAGGKIFTMAARKDGQFIVALDLETHAELWAAKVSDKNDEPRCTPTFSSALVFALSTDGELVAVEAANGHEVWRKNFERDFGGKMMSGWHYSESPLFDGEKLIVTPGGKDAALVAMNKMTGAVLWKTALPDLGSKGTDGAGYTGAVISNAGGVRQYVQLLGRGVVGVSADDGKLLWFYNRVANGTANIPTPLAWGDYVFCSTGYGAGAALLTIKKADAAPQPPPIAPAAPAQDETKIAALTKKLAALTADIAQRRDVRKKSEPGTPEYMQADAAVQTLKPDLARAEEALNAARGGTGVPLGGAGSPVGRVAGSPVEAQEQYFLNASTFQNHHGGMIRLGDYIYAGTGHNNGFPICLEWKTGKVVWNQDRGPGKESAAVVAADGNLYFRYQNAVMALIEATPDGYHEKGAFLLPSHNGESWSHPVIHGGHLYLRDQDNLLCYDLRQK